MFSLGLVSCKAQATEAVFCITLVPILSYYLVWFPSSIDDVIGLEREPDWKITWESYVYGALWDSNNNNNNSEKYNKMAAPQYQSREGKQRVI